MILYLAFAALGVLLGLGVLIGIMVAWDFEPRSIRKIAVYGVKYGVSMVGAMTLVCAMIGVGVGIAYLVGQIF